MRPPELLARTGRLLPPIPCGTWFTEGRTQRLNAVFGPQRGDQCSAPLPFSAA